MPLGRARLGGGATNDSRRRFINIDAFDPPYYCSAEVGRPRALLPQHFFAPDVYKTPASVFLHFQKSSKMPSTPFLRFVTFCNVRRTSQTILTSTKTIISKFSKKTEAKQNTIVDVFGILIFLYFWISDVLQVIFRRTTTTDDYD